MALSFIGSAENNVADASVSTITLTLPAGIAENDVVYVAYVASSNGGADKNMAMTTTGYSELADLFANDADECNLGVYRKLMGATPDSTAETATVATGGVPKGAAVCHVWRGVDTTTPEDATTTTATAVNSAIPNSPSIITVTANAIVLSAVGSSQFDATVTAPAGYANQVDITGPDTRALAGIASKSIASPGTEDPAAWTDITDAATEAWCAATVAIRPAAAGGTLFVNLAGHGGLGSRGGLAGFGGGLAG